MEPDSRLEAHYRDSSEASRLTRNRIRRLEFETTLQEIGRHLRPAVRLLELGAGHGAYSLHYARQGHTVLATDLVADNVQAIRAGVERESLESITVAQADATRLDGIGAAKFNAVLCLGPYYHLKNRRLRRRCLDECRRVLCDDGILFLSYINLASAVNYLLRSGRVMTEAQYVALLEGDGTRSDYPDEFVNIGNFSTFTSVESELGAAGFSIVEHVGTDGASGFFASDIEQVPEAAFKSYRVFHLAHCREPFMVQSSSHALVIARKS